MLSNAQLRKFSPRNGHTLVVGVISRTSNCHGVLDFCEQANRVKGVIAANYNGPIKFHLIDVIKSAGRDTRDALIETEALIRTGAADVIAVADLTRLGRGDEVTDLLALAEEFQTQMLSLSDTADT